MKTFVDGLYKLTDYQFYLFSINCKLQIAIFTVFTVKTKNFGHLYAGLPFNLLLLLLTSKLLSHK